jgi:hypothetical protein
MSIQDQKHSMTMLLHIAHNVVTNSLSHGDWRSALQEYGCTDDVLEEGKIIYEAASLLRAAEIIAEDDLRAAEESITKQQNVIRESYLNFLLSATQAFGNDALEMLGLQKQSDKSKNFNITNVKNSFTKLVHHPKLAEHLGKNGFDTLCVHKVLQLIDKYDKSVRASVRLQTSLSEYSRKRRRVFSLLHKWLLALTPAAVTILNKKPELTETIGLEADEFSALVLSESSERYELTHN